MGIYVGLQGWGQSAFEIAPMPNDDAVRTSSRRAKESEKSLSEGAESPLPNKLSKKVAPSGFPVVEPAISLRIMEFAGTTEERLVRCQLTDYGPETETHELGPAPH